MDMRITHIIKTAISGLSLLASASGFAASENLPVNYVSIPAYNLITDTLFNLSPMEAGKRNPFLMSLVCDLARGDISQQDVAQRLSHEKIDPQKLMQTGTIGVLILMGEPSDRQLACAAYLATSLFLPTNTAAYFRKVEQIVPVEGQPKEKQEKSSWLPWKSSKEQTPAPQEVKKEQTVFNQSRFIQDKKNQLAVARATAQLYGVIAQNIPNKVAVDWATRQQQITEIARLYAGDYLKSVTSFYNADVKNPLTLEQITRSGYSVRNSTGHRIVKTGDEIQLFYQGVVWLGNGMILGKDYFVDITLFPATTKRVAAPVVRTGAATTKKK